MYKGNAQSSPREINKWKLKSKEREIVNSTLEHIFLIKKPIVCISFDR